MVTKIYLPSNLYNNSDGSDSSDNSDSIDSSDGYDSSDSSDSNDPKKITKNLYLCRFFFFKIKLFFTKNTFL